MRQRGFTDRVLRKFTENPNEMLDARLLCALLGIEWRNRQPIFNSLHELKTSREINCQKKTGERGSWYWYGDPDRPPEAPAFSPAPAATNTSKGGAAAPATTSPGAGSRPAPAGEAAARRKPRAKTTSSQKPGTLVALEPATDEARDLEVVFAITERGELGISQVDGEKKVNIAIDASAVRRLSRFLETTAALWRG